MFEVVEEADDHSRCNKQKDNDADDIGNRKGEENKGAVVNRSLVGEGEIERGSIWTEQEMFIPEGCIRA